MNKTIIEFKENSTCFLLCSCGEEVLSLNYIKDEDITELSIYSKQNSMSLWQRLRYVYNILVYGKPYEDQIVLDHQQIKQLSDFLMDSVL